MRRFVQARLAATSPRVEADGLGLPAADGVSAHLQALLPRPVLAVGARPKFAVAPLGVPAIETRTKWVPGLVCPTQPRDVAGVQDVALDQLGRRRGQGDPARPAETARNLTACHVVVPEVVL